MQPRQKAVGQAQLPATLHPMPARNPAMDHKIIKDFIPVERLSKIAASTGRQRASF
jgi:hypothetical protein